MSKTTKTRRPITRLNTLEACGSILDNEISIAQGIVDKFREGMITATLTDEKLAEYTLSDLQRVNSGEVSYQLVWHTEDVLRACSVLHLLLPLQRYFNGDDSVTTKLENMHIELERHTETLTGGKWGCTEPWRANSTSAVTNLKNGADCSACQVAIKVLRPMISALKSAAVLDPNQDKG